MKILTISAHFPPHHSGGYGIRVKDIMDGLAERGHEILVLTTKAKRPVRAREVNSNYPIERVLRNHSGIKRFLKELYFDVLDVGLIRRYINDFKPDLIYLGHIYPISKQLVPLLSSLSIKVLFDEGGNGLKGAWTDHGRWFRLLSDYKFKSKAINFFLPTIRRIILWVNSGKLVDHWSWPEKMRIIFNSDLNLNNAELIGVPVYNARVVHSGVDSENFIFKPRNNLASPIKIIIPGRIEPKKGQIDGVRLLDQLNNHGVNAELTFIGPNSNVDYYAQLVKEIGLLGLEERVGFEDMVSQEELVELYQQADICFFPSYHRSGFSRVPLEAMATGCIVISYGNEGSVEVIKNGITGFLVEPGEINEVGEIIGLLAASSTMVKEVCANAREEVVEKYSLPTYISQIEEILSNTSNSKYGYL